ncbi:hypothetical protein ABPG72_008626 [Tetrahymena utriculariae]
MIGIFTCFNLFLVMLQIKSQDTHYSSCSNSDPQIGCNCEDQYQSQFINNQGQQICICKEIYYQLDQYCQSYADKQCQLKIDNICEQNQYIDFTERKCNLCNQNCKTCYGNLSSNCCTCSQGYYLQEQSSCIQCSDNCLECTGADQCQNCSDGFYNENGKCKQCDSTCAICKENGVCIKCVDDQNGIIPTNYNNICICKQDFCPENNKCQSLNKNDICQKPNILKCDDSSQYFDYQNFVCQNCDQSCQTCKNSSSQCISCSSGYYLDDSNLPSCIICSNKCLQCLGAGQCQLCADGYFLEHGKCNQCDSTCAICKEKGVCSQCVDGQNGIIHPNFNNICICKQDFCLDKNNKCQSLNQNEICQYPSQIVCSQGYYFDYQQFDCLSCDISCQTCKNSSNQCINCASGYYQIDNFSCLKCHQSCQECQGNDINNCVQCASERFLYSGYCICNQGACENSDNFECTQSQNSCNFPQIINCEPGKFFQYIQNNYGCQQCNENCLTCIYSSLQCTSCKNGFYLEKDTCKPCHQSCQECSGPNNNQCQSCQSNRRLYVDKNNNSYCCYGQCLSCSGDGVDQCLSCPSERKLIQNQCVCIKGTCENENKQCKVSKDVCTSPSLLVCKSKQYFDYDQGSCQNCHNYCQTCRGSTSNGQDCLTCIDGRYIIRNNIGTDQELCGQCDYTCQTCNIAPNFCKSCDVKLNRIDHSDIDQTCPCDINSGYYEDKANQTCSKCHQTCKTCFGGQINNCYTCPDLFIFSKFKCVCQDGYYLDLNNFQCRQCNYQCQTCNDSQSCLSCPIDRQIQTDIKGFNECLCIPGLYDDQTSKECKRCQYSCQTCSDFNTCTTCIRMRNLLNSQCLCQDGYYDNSNSQQCEQCHFTCQKCKGPNYNDCLECPSNRLLDSESKKCVCIQSLYYEDPNTGECIRCHYSCQTCQSNSNQCLTCDQNQNRFLDKKSGVCLCNSSFYEDSQQICRSCHYSCLTCSGPLASQCTSCSNQNKRKELFDQQTQEKSCICEDGYYDQFNQPVCSQKCHNTCQACYGPELYQCTSCNTTLRDLNQGVCTCKNGYFNFVQTNQDDQCLPCHHSCATCFGPKKNQCITCTLEEYRISQPFANTCPCQDGYVDEGEDDPNFIMKCVKCDHSCKTCQIKKERCTQCYDPKLYYRYDQSSNYQCPCFKGYFDNGNTSCQQCFITCDECFGSSTNCINSCNPSDFRVLDNNRCVCMQGYYEIYELDGTPKKQCSPCNYTCLGCVENSSKCTSCKLSNTFRVDQINQNQCPCQDGYYDSGQAECSKCNYTCSKCSNQNNCTSCAANSNRVQIAVDPHQQNLFICPCQTGFYEDGKNNTVCAQCLPSCYTCLNKTSCDTCFNDQCSPNDTACNVKNQFRTIFIDPVSGISQCICKRGYYEDQDTKQCLKCNIECEECSSKNDCIDCNTAKTHRTVQNQQCLCQNGYYEVPNQINCEQCNATCTTCTSKDVCTLCDGIVQNRQLDIPSKKCVCKTFFFEVLNSPNCQACDYSCGSCDGQSNNNCLSCDVQDMRQLVDGKCICQEGYYDDGTKLCKKCDYTCKACLKSQTSCTKCDSGAQRYPSDSIAPIFKCLCQRGYYDDGFDTQCKQCYDQNQYCQECVSKQSNQGFICTTCNQSDQRYVDQNGYCKCMDGWYQDGKNRQCLKCSSFCMTCSDQADKCTSCYEQTQFRILNQAQFQCVCSQGYFDLGTEICGACHYSCLNCSSNSKFACTQCPGQPFSRNAQINSQGQCLCIDQFYDDGQNKSCVQCDQSCLGCYGPGNSNCNRCNTNNPLQPYYRYGISCVSQCPQGFFMNKQQFTCDLCEKQCNTCKDSKDFCQTCSLYRKEPPKCDCRDGYYESDFQCNSCSPRCSKCVLSESQCTECPSGRLSPPLCECQEGSVEDPITLKCIQYKMVCPVLENIFEISNSRALWFSQKFVQHIQQNYDKYLVKRRVYPVISIDQVDILLILGVAKFNNLGLYTYNMSGLGQLISVLEQNIDTSTIQVQQMITRIVTCDSDIILTVSNDKIKLWIITMNKQYTIIDIDQVQQELLFEAQNLECFISYEYNLGDVISKQYPTYSSMYSDGTKDEQPNVKILNLIYQQKQTNTVRALFIRGVNNIFQSVQKSEVINQSSQLTQFVLFDIDILHLNVDSKSIIINDKNFQYIYQRLNSLAFDSDISNWLLISKKSISSELGIDSSWNLVQIYNKDCLIYSNGIQIKSIQLSSLISQNQNDPIQIIYQQQVSQDIFNFNQYLQIDDSRAIILVNKPENVSSQLNIWDLKQNKIVNQVIQTDPSISCKFHMLLQSSQNSSSFVGVSLFLEDDPDQQNNNLASRNKCQSLFQIISVDLNNNLTSLLSNSILLAGGLRSILQEFKFSKFYSNIIILASYYYTNYQQTTTFFISIQEWNLENNTIYKNYQPVQCEDTSKYALYQISEDGKLIVCSVQKQLIIQYQQLSQDGSINKKIITPNIVQDFINIQHLVDTNYIVFYSQTQIELMDLTQSDNSLQLIQDKDLLNLRPLIIRSIQPIKDYDNPSQIALMVVISTRLVYFSLQTNPGSKRIIALDPYNGDNSIDPIYTKFDQIKYVKQYDILVHYFAQYSILNIVRYNIALKFYQIDSITYDIDTAVDTTKVFSDSENQYTFIAIHDNLKKKLISCNLQYNSGYRCDWTINYYNTYNSLSGFDLKFGIRTILVQDTNLLNSVTFAYQKSDNANTKLICTHTFNIINTNMDKESGLISTKPSLAYIMKRLYELQFSVNYPKEIYFMFNPNNSYDGSLLRWIQYIPIKQILIQNSESTNDDSSNQIGTNSINYPIITITQSTSILLNSGYISSIQFVSIQLNLLAKLGPQIPAITKQRYVVTNHNILYIKDQLNQIIISFIDSSINIDNKFQNQNQNELLQVSQCQFFFDGINNLIFNSLVINKMAAQMQENYSIIRIFNVQKFSITNSSLQNIILSQVYLLSLENTNSQLSNLIIFNLNMVAMNNDITLGKKNNNTILRNIQSQEPDNNLLIQDKQFKYFIDSKDQYQIPSVKENINQSFRKLKSTTSNINNTLLFKKPSWIVSPIVAQQKTQLYVTQMNATNVNCSDLCFGGIILNLFSNVTVQQSNFTNIRSLLGGAIGATNSFQILTIKKANFNSCKADWVGGSIYLDDSQTEEEGKLYTPQFYIQNVNFTGSSAIQGGALFLVDSTSMQNIYTKVSNIIFVNNVAQYGACLRYQGTSSQSIQQFLSNSVFINNKATYNGDKLLSYPSYLVMRMDNSTKYCSDQNSSCIINDIKSGNKYPGIIYFYAATDTLDIINLQNLYQTNDQSDLINYTVTLVSNDKVDITGKDTASYDPKTNSFQFDELILTSLPNTTQTVTVTTNAIQIAQNGQYSFSYQFTLYLNFRGCLEGEIYQSQALSNLYSCYTCKEGYYNLVQPLKGQTSCIPCPIDGGVICQGGNTIYVNKEYWRSQNVLELEYSQCKINPQACIGGFSYGNQLCQVGYIGPQCETCDDSQSYVKSNIYCQLCPEYRLNLTFTSLLILLYILYSIILVFILVHSMLKKILIRNIHQTMNRFIKQNQKINRDLYKFIKVEQGDEVSNCIKIILHHFQIMIVIKSFDFYFPKFLEDAISISGSPPDTMIQSFSCLLYPLSKSLGISNAYSKVLAMFLLYIFVNLVMYYFSVKAFRNNQKRQLYFNSTSMLVNLNLFQPTLFLISIDLITCRQIINGQYLKGDLRIECNSSTYKKGIFIVIPIMIIMNLILPFFIYYRINYHKKIGQHHQYSYQIGHYKKITFYWELVKSIMKLLIYTCASVFYDYPTNRAVFIIFVLIVYFLFQNRMSPYRVEMMGKMDNESTIIGWISLLMIILIVENRNQYYTTFVSFSVLIAVNVAFFILVLARLIKSSYFFRNFMVRARLTFTRITIFRKLMPKQLLRKIYFDYLCQRIQLKMQKESRARSIANSLLGFSNVIKQNKQKYIQTQKPSIISFQTDTTYSQNVSQNMQQCLIELEDLSTNTNQNIITENDMNQQQSNQISLQINEPQPQQAISTYNSQKPIEDSNLNIVNIDQSEQYQDLQDQQDVFNQFSLSNRIERNEIQIEKPSYRESEFIARAEVFSFDSLNENMSIDIESNGKSSVSSKSKSFSPLIDGYNKPFPFIQNQVSLDLAIKNKKIIKYNPSSDQVDQQPVQLIELTTLNKSESIKESNQNFNKFEQSSNLGKIQKHKKSLSQNSIYEVNQGKQIYPNQDQCSQNQEDLKNTKTKSTNDFEKSQKQKKIKSKKNNNKNFIEKHKESNETGGNGDFKCTTGMIDNDQL